MARPFNTPKPLPSAEALREMFAYEPDTGILTWRSRSGVSGVEKYFNTRFAGKKAGSAHLREKSKYLRVMIDGAHHFVHRIIWKMQTGVEATFVDHIDGNGGNNRFENLRDVTFAENLKNQAMYKNNTSGFSGVMFHNRDKAWIAKIGVDGTQVQLGSFKTKEEAIAAVMAARIILNYHPNHGRAAA